ncbi:MAG: hypothetical protein AAF997_19775 [Myxococcota bacterium]
MRGDDEQRGTSGFDEPVAFCVRGSCMRGLGDGERVQVRRRRRYFPGDVVVVRRADHFSIHRFLGYAWSGGGWLALTQADRDPCPDPASHVRAVVGAADATVRWPERVHALARYVAAVARRAFRGRS